MGGGRIDSMKKWFLYGKKADFDAIAKRFSIDPVTARILRNRELRTEEEIDRYLNGGMEDRYSPLLLPDSIRCMNLLDRAVSEGRRIRIVGDYDVDGVCATYILYTGLKKLGASVDYEIPDRIRDGYGINRSIIVRAKEEGISLLLTCDNGISAIEELRYAGELGIQVLVTDHHDVRQDEHGRDILPSAAAVVDAKRQGSRYPFPEICGAVVAWKVIELLYSKRNLPKESAAFALEFAAIATVCDVVRLRDENRIIVREGLRQILRTENRGLRALLQVTGLLEQEKLSAYHLGFQLGPCINAGGRLESAKTALRLFLSEDEAEASSYAVRLKELNEARKDMTREACERAYEQVEQRYREDRVLVISLPELHESLAGIVAGRVRERYYRPSFVVTNAEPAEDGSPMSKGSGRSIEGYPMAERLSEAAELLTKFGGHPLAAGFSLRTENLERFRQELNRLAKLSEEALQEKLWIDVPMPIDYIREELVQEWEKLEPYGAGNEKPLFACKGLRILSVNVLGRNRNAVKLRLRSAGGRELPAMLFADGDAFRQELAGRSSMDIAYYPTIHEYQGKRELQLTISDYRLC